MPHVKANIHPTMITNTYSVIDTSIMKHCFNDLDAHLEKCSSLKLSSNTWTHQLTRLTQRVRVLSQLRLTKHCGLLSNFVRKHSIEIYELDRIKDLQSSLIDSIQLFFDHVVAFAHHDTEDPIDVDGDRPSLDRMINEGILLGPLWESYEVSLLEFMMESYFGEPSKIKDSNITLESFSNYRGSLIDIQSSIVVWSQSKASNVKILTGEKPRLINAADDFMLRVSHFSRQVDSYANSLSTLSFESDPSFPPSPLSNAQLLILMREKNKIYQEWKSIDRHFIELTMDAYLQDVGGQG